MTIGKYNVLHIERVVPIGMILSDETGQEVLLPRKWIPVMPPEQEELEVFVYQDHLHRPIATTLRPKILLNQFAFLRVRQVNEIGAFLDWGMEKDLMVPFREQEIKMQEGQGYIVFLYMDDSTGRLVASARRNRFLDKQTMTVEPDEEVDLLVCDRTEIGMSLIVNNLHSGLVYFNEIFKPIKKGDSLKGYVKNIRPDGNLDISLSPLGVAKLDPSAEKVMSVLIKSGGFLPLNDASSPEEIRWELEMSKKTFKKAIGVLYKERRIRIETDGIHSTE